MNKTIVILANSVKHGKHCVAGKFIDTKQWIRPVANDSGKEITYQNLSAADYTQALTQAGLPAGLVDIIVDADIQTEKGAMFSDCKDLEQLIGHPTTAIKEQVAAILKA